ncbi:metal-sensitive transcriptional regulator [Scrofimicrobium sp. R131]|uniref:Metal-sensitive transcriptional regulator n=1 Tax=Scrofimicrobium appendicitidis TaxID=3079930 RepID=A0AAU7V8M2_9ACTO
MQACDPESQKKILNRLRRAQGQLNAVINAVDADSSCRDVVTQLAAVSRALDRAGFAIIATAMRACMNEADEEGGDDRLTPEELEKLFLTLS